MLNPAIDLLPDYPFPRLRALLDPLSPPEGAEVLHMSIGEPKHQPPRLVDDVLKENAGNWGSYPPVLGTPDLRRAIADWLKRRYGLKNEQIDPDRHILPVLGTREALFLIGDLVIPGKKGGQKPVVLIPNPFYQVYAGAAVMGGAEPVYMAATRETGFQPDLDALSPEILDRAALLYLCTPGNPQGAVADLDYLKKAVNLARKHDIVLIADECYAEIYSLNPPAGALEACSALGEGFENVLVFHSLSKRSNVPGLRSGFVAGDPALIAAFAHLRNYGGATMPLPVMAVSASLWREEQHVAENRRLYREKFDLADRILGDLPGYHRPDGGFFLWLEVGDGEKTAMDLWQQAAIRVLPGKYLGADDPNTGNPGDAFIRIALVHDLKTTEKALKGIAKLLIR
jgi:N-succinyldiaminopimelate aminotransferase